MALGGAAADRLRSGLGLERIAQRQFQQLLDQRRAGPAGRRRLGDRPDALQRRQSLAVNGRRDLALADAVAAAHLSGVRHRRNGRARVQTSKALRRRLTEHQRLADIADHLAGPHQVKIPRPIRRIAEQHRPGDPAALQYDPLIDPAPGVAEHDVLAALAAGVLAGRKHIDARDLQPRGQRRALIGRRPPGQRRAQRAAHVPDGRDEAIALAPVLDAFADGIDRRITGAEAVVDDHAPSDLQPRRLGQRGVRPDADRHHQQVAGQDAAVLEFEADHPARLADDLFGLGFENGLDALLGQRLGQQKARRSVQLALHQHVQQVDNSRRHSALGKAIGGLDPQQAAADHDGFRTGPRRRHHRLDVIEITEGDHALQVAARQGQLDRIGTGGQDQPVVGNLDPAGAHRAALPIKGFDGRAGVQGDAVVGIPGLVVDHDIREGLLAGQHRREHDPVVVHPRLGPEDGDLVAVRIALQHLLHRPAAGHAVADDNQLFLGHRRVHSRAAAQRSRRSAPARSCASAP